MGGDDCAADCALLQGPARGEHAEYAELVRKIYCNEIDLRVFACGQKIIIKSHEADRQISRLSVKRAAVSISLH